MYEGWLDVSNDVIIPDDLAARLSVAEGLIGASDDEWLDYSGMYERAARPAKHSQFTSYEGFSCLLTYRHHLTLQKSANCLRHETKLLQSIYYKDWDVAKRSLIGW